MIEEDSLNFGSQNSMAEEVGWCFGSHNSMVEEVAAWHFGCYNSMVEVDSMAEEVDEKFSWICYQLNQMEKPSGPYIYGMRINGLKKIIQ
jgi:hypothetical protein